MERHLGWSDIGAAEVSLPPFSHSQAAHASEVQRPIDGRPGTRPNYHWLWLFLFAHQTSDSTQTTVLSGRTMRKYPMRFWGPMVARPPTSVDRIYLLEQVSEAIRHLIAGDTRGKAVIAV